MKKEKIRAQRYPKNPILTPVKKHSWEKYVYNCGVVFLEEKVHIIYRALGKDRVSRFGYAQSKDGFEITERAKKPIFLPQLEAEQPMVKFHNTGVEDPRLTVLEDKLYMVYVATNGRIAQVAMTSIKLRDFLAKRWLWEKRNLIFPNWDNRNAVLFPQKIGKQYVLYHRLKPAIWVAYSRDLKKWKNGKIIMAPRKGMWDDLKIGAAGPPIKLGKDWLFIYHGVEVTKKGNVYRLGYAIIDGKNPEKVLKRGKDPILEPEKDYEKKGQVQNVVFSCGAVVKGDKLFIYYGGADTVIAVATIELSDFL